MTVGLSTWNLPSLQGDMTGSHSLASVGRAVWDSLRFCAIYRQLGLYLIMPVHYRATVQMPGDEGSSIFFFFWLLWNLIE